MEDTAHFIGFVAIEVARASDCRVVGSAEYVAADGGADINRLKCTSLPGFCVMLPLRVFCPKSAVKLETALLSPRVRSFIS
jgi:hypothetical protein